MVGDHDADSAIIVESAAEAAQGLGRPEQCLAGDGAQAADELGLDDLQLPFEEGPAIRRFVGLRRAVLGRAALQHVQDVDIFAFQRAGLDDLVQQLPGRSDERFSLPVFVGPWGFAEETQPGFRISSPKDGLGAALRQLVAQSTVNDLAAHPIEGRRRIFLDGGNWWLDSGSYFQLRGLASGNGRLGGLLRLAGRRFRGRHNRFYGWLRHGRDFRSG